MPDHPPHPHNRALTRPLSDGQRHRITRGSREAIDVRVTRHAHGQKPVWLVRLDAGPPASGRRRAQAGAAGTDASASEPAADPPHHPPPGSSGRKRPLLGKIRGEHAIALIVDPLARNWLHLWQLATANDTIETVPKFQFDVTLLAPRQRPQVTLWVASHGTFQHEVVDFADPDAWDTTMFALAREALGALDPTAPPALSVLAAKGAFTRHGR